MNIALSVCDVITVVVIFLLARTDLDTHKVSNKWVLGMLIGGIAPLVLDCLVQDKWYIALVSRFGGLIACFGLMLAACAISKGGFGGGDIKLMTAIGFIFGFWGGMFIAVLSSAMYLGACVWSKRRAAKMHRPAPKVLPYVPYIFLASIPVALYLCIPADVLSSFFTF